MTYVRMKGLSAHEVEYSSRRIRSSTRTCQSSFTMMLNQYSRHPPRRGTRGLWHCCSLGLSFAALFLLLSSMLQGVHASAKINTEVRLHERHDVPPSRKEIPTTTREASTTALLVSTPCQVESDGYFGSTFGDPAILEYAVQLFTKNHDGSTLPTLSEEAIRGIRESIMESVIEDSFPTLCRSQRKTRRMDEGGHYLTPPTASGMITGFWFAKDMEVDSAGMLWRPFVLVCVFATRRRSNVVKCIYISSSTVFVLYFFSQCDGRCAAPAADRGRLSHCQGTVGRLEPSRRHDGGALQLDRRQRRSLFL